MNSTFLKKTQEKLEIITRKWWLYLLLLLLIFTGTYSSKGYDVRQSIKVIVEALMSANIYQIPALFPIAKAIPIILIICILILGNKMRNIFNIYITLLFLGIAIFQNTAQTETYGMVGSIGNLLLVLVVALSWFWEIFAQRNDFSPRKLPLWRWWVMPLAILAILAPVNSSTFAPDFSPAHMLTNEAGLTSCMIFPAILAVLSIYYPTINRVVLRLMSFVGMIFGFMNMVVWFFTIPAGWWMGVLHLPLLSISIYTFILGQINLARPYLLDPSSIFQRKEA